MKTVVFRVDAGLHIGMGHLMRCSALAMELKRKNVDVHFITKTHTGADLVEVEKHFEVTHLPHAVTSSTKITNVYESWLGTTVSEDLELTNKYLALLKKVNLVIVDHYALNASYEHGLKANNVMAIDDLYHRIHNVKFLLNRNLGTTPFDYRESIVEEFFLGPKFSLLRPEFGILHDQIKLTNEVPIKKILIFFGLGDIHNNCLGLAQSLTESELQNYQFTFIINNMHPDYPELLKFQEKYQSIKIISKAVDMAKLMIEHDFFIGAGGTTSWERAALGIPSAIICLAENQKEICNALSREEWSIYLGEGKLLATRWQMLFKGELQNYEKIKRMRSISYTQVDGRGTERVAERILERI